MAFAGYTECLTFSLISLKEQFSNFNIKIEEKSEKAQYHLNNTVQISQAKTTEFQVFRNSLIPGILKTIEANKANNVEYLF